MTTVFLNGQFMPQHEARISPLDRGFLFADGIYEVIPAYNSVPFRLDAHLRRLERSLNAIRLLNPYSDSQWQALLSELIERNGGGNLSLYLQITRGAPSKRDHAFPPADEAATIFAMTGAIAVPEADSPDTATGIAAITLDDIRWARCDIKSVSLLPNILLRQQAMEAGASEALLIKDGYLTEGAASNAFIVKDNVIITPPQSHNILGGITRDIVIELCQQHRLPLEQREVLEAELHQADEIWVSSSTKEVVPVVQLNNKPVANGVPGDHWKTLARHYVQFKRDLCGIHR